MYKLTNLNACYNPFGRFVYTCAQLTTEIVLYCLPKPLAFSCILSNWPRDVHVNYLWFRFQLTKSIMR